MTISRLPQFFAESYLAELATQLGILLDHPDQLAFLQSTESLDLQAAPGSGKTTLLAAKLCLIGRSWNSPNQGVCVLSHTNTAKDQIISRTKTLPAGRTLLQYPHFIGTIQSFVNVFFAMPYLRSKGIDVQFIDDEQYEAAALETLQKNNRYFTLRSFLERRRDGEVLVQKGTYVFLNNSLEVEGHKPLPFSSTSKSGQQFVDLKNTLAKRGMFRYGDMFAIASKYLAVNPHLASVARARFPFVLIDEMQDTSRVQEDFLSRLFPPDIGVVQRVGDVNQRIFGDSGAAASATTFPHGAIMELPISRRFGPEIAEVATSLTVHRQQEIRGEGSKGVCALLVFDRNSIHQVVPEFERLSSLLVPAEALAKYPAVVLGARKVPGTSKTKFPQSLACYMPELARSSQNGSSNNFISIVRQAKVSWATSGNSKEAASLLWSGTSTALQLLGARIDSRRPTPSRVATHLEREKPDLALEIREIFLSLLGANLSDENAWQYTMLGYSAILRRIHVDDGAVSRLTQFLAFSPNSSGSEGSPDSYENSDTGPRTVRSDTIHNAKGETHSATLIVECLERTGHKHDVYEALKMIRAGRVPANAASTVRASSQLIFVGVTRPTHLLAMAVLRERAEEHLGALQGRGWQVHHVHGPSTQS